MRALFFVSILGILSVSCNEKKACYEKGDELAIQKSIEKVIELREKDLLKGCYLVSPYLDTLSLNPYSEKEKESLFNILGMSENQFYEAQTEVQKCGNHYEESLMRLSSCNEGYGVFKVNKVFGNLVQVRYTDYYEQVGIQELKDRVEIKPNQMFEYVCVLKNGEVEIVLETSTFYD